MGSGEMDKSTKEMKETKESKTPTTQEQSSTTSTGTVNPEWSGFQAYSPMPPHGFLASSPQAHPYMWGVQHLMPPYGTPPHPYIAMYPHGGMYAHPSMPPGSYPFSPFAMPSPNGIADASVSAPGSMEMDAKLSEGKEKLPIKRSKGSLGSLNMITGKDNEPGKTSGASGNGVYSKSAESASDGSSEGSDANSQNDSQMKSGCRQDSLEAETSQNGSTDGTKRVAFDFMRKYTVDYVRVILLGRNHGKGEAIRKGMLHSRGQLLLMLDADGATKVNDLEKLENQICAVARKEFHGESAASDSSSRVSDIPVAAFGSRAHLEEKALATRKWYRNFLMKGFHVVVLLTAGSGIRDTQCGFKMFTRAAARKLFTNIRLKRWCFDVELVYLCKWFRIPIIEISVNWSEIPGSKVNPLSIPNMLWEMALMSVGYRTGMWRIST